MASADDAAGDPAASEDALDERLSRPGSELPSLLAGVAEDLVILGAGGKMGPTLARMARRALDAAGGAAAGRRVIAVSRFTEAGAEQMLNDSGVETVRCDLSDCAAVDRLPDAGATVFMAGQKFGTVDSPGRTWVANTVVPANCARRYAGQPMVALSSGNVYPLTNREGNGSAETDAVGPIGEYAFSTLARERILEWHAEQNDTPLILVRLFYANALRYGVLTDIARRVWTGAPVDVTMSAVNVIWQGDANRLTLSCLGCTASPPAVVNLAGTEASRVRWLASELGERLGRKPVFAGEEAPDALLADVGRMRSWLGTPEVNVAQLLDWTASWLLRGGGLLAKPTGFQVRDGAF